VTTLDLVRKGWPVTLEMTATLPAPSEVIWELITDWEHLDEWMLEASDFLITSPQRTGVGVEAEATIMMAVFRSRDRIRVSGWEEGRFLAIEHLGWVGGVGEMSLTPRGDDATFLLWREKLWPPLGLVGALGLSAIKPLMQRIFDRDVRILAALARARGGS
jgi:uncharacterized protein YndB with AHSA1/START domain